MRILIRNYTSVISTEAMYFSKCLELAGHEVHLWSENTSVFDTFDAFSPDLFVTHFQFLDNDAIKYLSQNKNVKLVVNCTGMTTDQLKILEEGVESNKIDCPFLFTNAGSTIPFPKPEKIRMESILPGLDIFLPPQQIPDYSIDRAILATETSLVFEQQKKPDSSYHLMKLTANDERDKNFDMPVNLLSLRGMYDRYKEILFVTPMAILFSQLFYEAVYYSNKISFKLSEEEQPMFDKFLGSVFKEEKTDDLSQTLKSQIKSNHTCVSRAARFCKFLKDSEGNLKLQKIKGNL